MKGVVGLRLKNVPGSRRNILGRCKPLFPLAVEPHPQGLCLVLLRERHIEIDAICAAWCRLGRSGALAAGSLVAVAGGRQLLLLLCRAFLIASAISGEGAYHLRASLSHRSPAALASSRFSYGTEK